MGDSPKPAPAPKGSELLRENVFGCNETASSEEEELLLRRQPTMLRRGKKLIAPPHDTQKRYTVVFDLDETVVYARDGPLYARAYLRDLLRAIKDDFEVIVWTAGERSYAKSVLEEINEDHIIRHLVYRHKKWFHGEDYTKDLRQLGRDLDFTIMIENTPDCVRVNPENSIIVEDFEVPQEADDDELTPPQPTPSDDTSPAKRLKLEAGRIAGQSSESEPVKGACGPDTSTTPAKKTKRVMKDRTLFLLQEVLLTLVRSGKTVPQFLSTCELLSKQTVVGSDGKEIPTYHLGTRRKRGTAAQKKVVKPNRDKVAPTKPLLMQEEKPSKADVHGNRAIAVESPLAEA